MSRIQFFSSAAEKGALNEPMIRHGSEIFIIKFVSEASKCSSTIPFLQMKKPMAISAISSSESRNVSIYCLSVYNMELQKGG